MIHVGVLSPVTGGFYFGEVLAGVVREVAGAGGRVTLVQTLDAGRAGGAVLGGAGGGGFLLVYSDDSEATRAAMDAAGAPELRFAVEQRGCTAGPA